ncbi:MAG: hypothetical protein D6712_03035 [Chloroflexi bacterium]|nr:MAG: hypothetical protein D6712_03035 [Chloroflexota bacterium]
MPVTIEKMDGMPVIVATFKGHVDVSMVKYVFNRTAELCEGIEGPIFRISDVSEATSSFVEMLGVIREAGQGGPGSTTDPRIRAVFVGSNQWTRLMRDALQQPQFGGVNMPAFTSMEDAMTYIRHQLGLDNDVASG